MSETKLTIADPVAPETLAKFAELQTARLQAAERLLDLEQDKIRVLRAASSIDTERQKLFEEVLIARGLSPTAVVEINAQTGLITPVGSPPPSPAPEAPAEGGLVRRFLLCQGP
jgi:phosphoenolpyruvate-protein kinase (PTS system EI component)